MGVEQKYNIEVTCLPIEKLRAAAIKKIEKLLQSVLVLVFGLTWEQNQRFGLKENDYVA